MPLFDHEQTRDLVGDQASADYELDLRGVTAAHARIAIERMLERRRFVEATTVVIRIDPATPTSGETLFLPVGRQLLEARRRKLVRRFAPLPEGDGGGFHVELPDNPARSGDSE
ncbi:hypothetical protein [Pelagibius sp.]|uniref:hypothetical protein n=1 Tax=Pelagibius sp. TaxID=1931238 RepID=UPI003B503BE7